MYGRAVPTKPKPVAYAEDTLDVHTTLDRTTEALDALAAAQENVVRLADRLRTIRERISDAEANAAIDLRGLHPEWSQTQFEKELRIYIQLNGDLSDQRATLREAQFEHEFAEAEVRKAEFFIKVGCARLVELGGLLNFYAANSTSNS